MNPICSILIPTRNRVPRLEKTIRSIRETSKAEQVEILIRADDDDPAMIEWARHPMQDVKILFGSRLNGYKSMGEFIKQLSDAARGTWVSMVDDDVTLVGNGWDEQLKALPLDGVLAQPEYYHLNASKYPSGSCGPVGWFVPNKCWEKLGEKLDAPVDEWMYNTMVKGAKWRVHLLTGIIYKHDRDTDDKLEQHRK